MTTRTVSFRTDEETLKKIDELAAHEDRSRNWWLNSVIQAALREEEAWEARVREGMQEADAGEFASDEEVTAVFEKHRGTRQ